VTVVRQAPALSGASRPDDILLALLGWVGLLLAGWLALGSLLAVAALLPGAAGRTAAAVAERVTPVAVRKVLALALGASVGSLALPPTLVSVAGSGPVTRTTDGSAPRIDAAASNRLAPGFTPTEATPGFIPTSDDARAGGASASSASRPAAVPGAPAGPGYAPTDTYPDSAEAGSSRGSRAGSTGAPARTTPGPGYVPTTPPPVHDAERPRLLAPTPRRTTAAHDLVTVRRGDSLWSIAARHLGPGTSDAEIAWEWPRWYAANRAVVGDDPDLLVPGQLLRPPPSTSAPTSHRSTLHPSAPEAGATSTPAPQGVQ
jgi:nucleoid-associated protein YgaU